MDGTNVLTSYNTQTSPEVQLIGVNGNKLALNSQKLQERLADMAAKMVTICSSLQDVIEIVQVYLLHGCQEVFGDHVDNIEKNMISTIHGTVNKVQENVSYALELNMIWKTLKNQHFAVYVLDWMDKNFPLQNNDFGVVTEEVIMMMLTMNLLLGDYNELKKKLEDDSVLAWSTKRAA
ncbi:hypothetical protein QL285_026332 [Trifolium repens]|nr:hypothetical protein QL285_026332 [Trifolium repens]